MNYCYCSYFSSGWCTRLCIQCMHNKYGISCEYYTKPERSLNPDIAEFFQATCERYRKE